MKGLVSAVLVTRGNVDVAPVVESLIGNVDEIVVWDNGAGAVSSYGGASVFGPPLPLVLATGLPDLSVYGRYAAIPYARADRILVQDDDCLLPPSSIAALLQEGLDGAPIICNMPEPFRAHYSDSGLVGFGAAFDRDLPAAAFERFHRVLDRGNDEHFLRCCDVVLTTLVPMVWVDVPYANLPYATGPDRMYRQPTHGSERAEMLRLARAVRDA